MDRVFLFEQLKNPLFVILAAVAYLVYDYSEPFIISIWVYIFAMYSTYRIDKQILDYINLGDYRKEDTRRIENFINTSLAIMSNQETELLDIKKARKALDERSQYYVKRVLWAGLSMIAAVFVGGCFNIGDDIFIQALCLSMVIMPYSMLIINSKEMSDLILFNAYLEIKESKQIKGHSIPMEKIKGVKHECA